MGAFPPPLFLDVLLTDDCNCRCDYCFVGKSGQRSRLSFPVAKQTIDFLLDSWEGPEEPGILLFGGEPLLEPDLIRYVVEYAKRRAANGAPRIDWSMTTNGTLMTEPMMAYLAANRIRYLLSIDGNRETHDRHRKLKSGKGSFDRLAERLPLMKSYQPWLGARMTPTPQTAAQLCRGVDELCDLGLNQFIIGMASGVTWTEPDTATFIEQMMGVYEVYLRRTAAGQSIRLTLFEKDSLDGPGEDLTNVWGCGAGRRRLCVNARGELFGCARFAAIADAKGALPLGDVWRGTYRTAARESLCRNTAWGRLPCVECAYRGQCTGGCPAVNFAETGSVFDPSPNECLSTRVYAELKERLARHPSRPGNATGPRHSKRRTHHGKRRV
ncbi:MAG: radical SAM protein [Bryobacteraceae bacterium]|jgi:uncharacterized protein